jgi:hypothetical protein
MTGSDSVPRAEHPNPIFYRDAWQSLNGPWEFCFDPQNQGEQRRWWASNGPTRSGGPGKAPFDRRIVVPFPWESPASGIAEPGNQGVAWYRRSVHVPTDWTPRGLQPVLHFGAVDWEARVWVNGRIAGEHRGGYTPFSVELAPFLAGDAPLTVTVRVRDDCDAATLLGKQVVQWYTHSSGIWQPVWLEGRPADHIAAVALQPHLAAAGLDAEVTLNCSAGEYVLQVSSPDGQFAQQEQTLTIAGGEQRAHLTIPIDQPRAWSPEDPHLYPVEVTLRRSDGLSDRVQTYTGLRDVQTGAWEGRPYDYVLLNGEPVYLRLALDQAFHPDGVYTYPSDDAIRADLQIAKDAGLNGLRCHIKVNDPRYYYWADRLGLLIMQDMPNPAISTPASQRAWQACLQATLARDGNHPAIFCWVLFNETWGLTDHRSPASWHWLAEQVAMTKALDPTRLVEDNSPCNYDHVVSDLNSWHFYIGDWAAARRHVQAVVDQTLPGATFNYVSGLSELPEAQQYCQHREPLLNSEYAGLGAGGGDRDISQSLKYLTTDLRRHDKICGYVYTELTDVEWEHNGLVEYDRSRKEFGYDAFVPGMTTADLLGPDVVGLDCPPCQTLKPDAVFSAPAFVSHWSKRDLKGSSLHWRMDFIDRLGERYVFRDGALPLQLRRYALTEAGTITAKLPAEPGLVTLALRLVAADGSVIARNYVNIEVWAAAAAREERLPSGWALRVAPGDYLASTWPVVRPLAGGGKVGAGGSGSISYAFPWPSELAAPTVRGFRLKLELGAHAAAGRNTRWGGKAAGYPQTEPDRRMPGDIVLHLNGTEVARRRLADDANDARGILSFQQQTSDDSSYGELLEVSVPAEAVPDIVKRAQATGKLELQLTAPGEGGLARGVSIYGERIGAFPLDPTLLVDLGG